MSAPQQHGSVDVRLLQFLGDALHERHATDGADVDDAFALVLRGARLVALAARMGLRHPSFAAEESRLFVTTTRVIDASAWCVGVLASAGVPVATYKGPALAVQLFGDPVVRPSSDVDLLVAPRDLERARAALHAAGLERDTRYPDWYDRRWHYHEMLHGVPGHKSMPIELHWSFARPGLAAGDVTALLDELVAVDCQGHELPAPTAPWNLLAGAVHAVQHYFTPRPLFDVAMLAARLDAAGWSRALRLAGELRLEPALYYALTVSGRRLGWTPPEPVRVLRPARWRDVAVESAVARLPLVEFPGRGSRQMMKAITPLACTSGGRWLVGLAYQLSDRPRVVRAVERRAQARGARRRAV